MEPPSKLRQVLIAATVGSGEQYFFSFLKQFWNSFNISAYTVWGILIYLQPPFYPSEAEKRGATPSQVRITLLASTE